MRHFVLVVFVLVLASSEARTQRLEDRLVVYRPAGSSVTLLLPDYWRVDDTDPSVVLFSPAPAEWQEDGRTSAPHPWAYLVVGIDDICPREEGKPSLFYPPDSRAKYREALACAGDASLVAGYWEDDPDKVRHVQQLTRMLKSLRRVH